MKTPFENKLTFDFEDPYTMGYMYFFNGATEEFGKYNPWDPHGDLDFPDTVKHALPPLAWVWRNGYNDAACDFAVETPSVLRNAKRSK
jgi:hypothetical protein